MTSELPETLTISKTILSRIAEASIAGDNGIDEQGRVVVQLGVRDQTGRRQLRLAEGETFEFAGATWTVTTINEPTTAMRGPVATLTREA